MRERNSFIHLANLENLEFQKFHFMGVEEGRKRGKPHRWIAGGGGGKGEVTKQDGGGGGKGEQDYPSWQWSMCLEVNKGCHEGLTIQPSSRLRLMGWLKISTTSLSFHLK